MNTTSKQGARSGNLSAPTNNILVTYGALQVLYCIGKAEGATDAASFSPKQGSCIQQTLSSVPPIGKLDHT